MKQEQSDLKTIFSSNNEVVLNEIFIHVFSAKWFILFLTLLFLIFGLIYLKFANYTYEVKLEVISIQNSSGKIATDGLGALQELAGFSLKSEGFTNFELYKVIYKSRLLANEVFNDRNLMKLIFPGQWDEKLQKWTLPKVSLLTNIKLRVKSLLMLPNSKLRLPSVHAVERFLKQNIIIDENSLGITIIIFNTSDPKSGKEILTSLNYLADEIIKKRILHRSVEYSNFLTNKLNETLNKDQRISIINALSQQQQTQMMASTSLPFAAEKFADVYASEGPNKPNPVRVLLLFITSGFFLSIIISTIRFFYSK